MDLTCGSDTLYYEIHGSGEPILLLHGNGENHTYFKYQVPFLCEEGYQVILLDMRGHGTSTLNEMPIDFHVFAEDVKTLCDELHLSSLHILGFSDGANTALQFALSYPSYVKSLILNGGNLNTTGIRKVVQTVIVFGYYLLRFFALFSKTCKKKCEVIGLMVNYPHIDEKCLTQVTIPTLVIAGENDIVRTSHTELIAASIPKANLVILPKGDHSIAQKQPQAFNQAIKTFLEEASDGR